jgi:hypothetical protein
MFRLPDGSRRRVATTYQIGNPSPAADLAAQRKRPADFSAGRSTSPRREGGYSDQKSLICVASKVHA